MKGSKRLTIVIVSYNTREMTLDCLRSVIAETKQTDFEIIVVDNESHDGSAESIAEEFPQISLIRAGKNLGFAAANNLAVSQTHSDYILLLNPDTVILDNAIDKLMACAAVHPKARIWGGRTLFGNRNLDPTSCWRRMTLWSLFCHTAGLNSAFPNSPIFNSEAYGGWRRDSLREVDIVCGCFLLIERSLWEKLGGFDKAYFMYGEEADLCLRAEHFGASPMITPDATIIHYGGASETVRTDKMIKLLSAKARLIQQYWGPLKRTLGLALLQFWPWSRWIANRGLFVLTARKKYKDGAKTWGEVWASRAKWRSGYGELAAKMP